MNNWKVLNIVNLDQSNNINNSGFTPKVAKQEIKLVNQLNHQTFITTDLDVKKNKRKNKFTCFVSTYKTYCKKKAVSIIGLIIDSEKYPDTSEFINSFKKQLKRRGIRTLGYISTRDVGDNKFRKHVHVLLATNYIDSAMFNSLYSAKKHSNYEVELIKYVEKMTGYLIKKELFGIKRQRAFSCSMQFILPAKSQAQQNKQINAI